MLSMMRPPFMRLPSREIIAETAQPEGMRTCPSNGGLCICFGDIFCASSFPLQTKKTLIRRHEARVCRMNAFVHFIAPILAHCESFVNIRQTVFRFRCTISAGKPESAQICAEKTVCFHNTPAKTMQTEAADRCADLSAAGFLLSDSAVQEAVDQHMLQL
jgi:hypothetical protein